MLRLTTLLLLALMAQAPANTAVIVGRVVDQSDGKAIGGAVVEIVNEAAALGGVAPNAPPRRQMTDALGRFVFRELPAGTYSVRARVGGNGYSVSGFIASGFGNPIGAYVPGGFGQRRPGGPLEFVSLAEGQAVPDLVVGLWRGGVLSGTVLDDLGDPVVDTFVGAVQVSSDGRLTDGPTTKTDDRGRYRLSSLLPGRYIVFVPQTVTSMPSEMADDSLRRIGELNAGRTPSEALLGIPEATGIRVGNSIINTSTTSSYSPVTLAPRRVDDTVFVFQTTFHPQATSLATATAVDLGSAEEKAGVDVSLIPVRTAAVSGVVVDQGTPAAGLRLRLLPAGSAPETALFEAATTLTDALGRFTFPVVPVGNYTIATLIPPPAPVTRTADRGGAGFGAWLSEPVVVSAEGVTGLLFSLKRAYTLTAQVEFVGSGQRPSDQSMTRFTLGLRSVRPRGRMDPGNGGAQAALTATAGLSLAAITPGRYVLRLLASPPGPLWRIQSVTIGGREVNDLPIEIGEDLRDLRVVLTDAPASVGGRVTFPDPAGRSPAAMLFPADRQLWADARALTRRFRLVRTSSTGDFSIPDVPPGDYLVVAVLDEAAANWPDAAFLNAIAPLADAVRVTAGNRSSVSLTTKTVVKRP